MSNIINTSPLLQFIKKVHSADLTNAKEVKLTLQEAKTLSSTIGLIMTRLEGDLEKIIAQATNTTKEIIDIKIGENNTW